MAVDEHTEHNDSETARLILDVEDPQWSDPPLPVRFKRHGRRFKLKQTLYSRAGILLVFFTGVLMLLGLVVITRSRSYQLVMWDGQNAVFDEEGNLVHHPHYLVFESSSSPPVPVNDRPVRSIRRLPNSCVDEHIAYGAPCADPNAVTFDLVWTWVNGSDPRLEQAIAEAAREQRPTPQQDDTAAKDPESKLYRDHDELRHSFRSVLKNFRPYIRKFRLFASDFPFSEDEYMRNETQLPGSIHVPNKDTVRLGQLPSWLIPSETGVWKDENVELEPVYHSQVFEHFDGASFNSLGIETQLPNIPDVQDNVIYLNDDFYFTAELKPSDFWTPAYGTILRFDIAFLIGPSRASDDVNPAGEWGPLGTASWLLSERFGARGRPYPKHAAKPFPMAMLEESARMWTPEFRQTLSHKFRGLRDSSGQWDAYITFLTSHLIVERSRESLLWSWIVGRIGGDDNDWGFAEKILAWKELGGNPDHPEKDIEVSLTPRETMQHDRVKHTLSNTGLEVSTRTEYRFSSLDGYPYGYTLGPEGETELPDFLGEHVGRHLCDIQFEKCINGASSASEAFKKMAFEDVQCGDCVISALRSASGRLGLSAFLPHAGRHFKSSDSARGWSDDVFESDMQDDGSQNGKNTHEKDTHVDPHLPFGGHWGEIDFSLQSVMKSFGDVNLHSWAVRLIERYKFVIGDTHTLFLMIENPKEAKDRLYSISPEEALLCVNDDVKEGFSETDRVMREWQERMWSHPAEWER
ncbi:hypothetical protein M422DRAFT_222969 [Sphaerobolus stellatus SS14]|nr:hypothetical protein M422DRAFT_222969 [Sphaerobolus stellatus SS14]